MRLTFLAAAVLSLSSCATAVYDSLDRRGVDAAQILDARISAVRDDATAAIQSLNTERNAIAAIGGLDGAPLARHLDKAKAAHGDASIAAQSYRLTIDNARLAGDRYLNAKTEEIRYLDASEISAARDALNSAMAVLGNFHSAATAARLAISPALTVSNQEISLLRQHSTSGAFAASRTTERQTAINALSNATDMLEKTRTAANEVLASTK